MVEDELEKQNLDLSMEKVKADASRLITCVRQLKGLSNHFDSVEANLKKRSRELELKEKELQNLSTDIDKRRKKFEAEKAEAGDLKKLVEDCTVELRSKRNELTAKLDTSTRIQREIELKNKHLGQVMAELRRRYSEACKVQEHKREMEDETARKTKDLGLILVEIGESDKQLEKTSRELELKKKELQILSLNLEKRGIFLEVEKTEVDLKVIADGLKKDIEEKGKELDLVKSQVKSWEKKLIQLTKLVHDCSRKDQVDSSKNIQGETELKKKQLGQTKTVLVKHSGVEEENLGKLSSLSPSSF